jgi:AmiR/NasT family two-component response regulator
MGLEKSKEHDGPILNRPISSASIGIVDGYADDRRINFPKANRILVVEDEFLIAQGIKNIVHSLGYGVIGPVAEETAAIDLIESEKPAAAIIDIRLRGKNISRLPVALMDFNVPFFYCTAFAPGNLLPKQLCEAPVVNKLAVEELLPATLRNLLH